MDLRQRLLSGASLLGCLAVAAFAAAVVYKAASQGYHFVSPARILLYLIIPALMILACGTAVFISRFRGVIFLNILALVAAIYAAEFTLQNFPSSSQKATETQEDPRSAGAHSPPTLCGQYSWGSAEGENPRPVEFSIEGRGGYVALGGISELPIPRYGRSTDQHGFNNPPGQWRPGEVEIAAIGDSFTWGHDVPPGKNFVDLIREQIGTTVNLGCGSSGPIIELATLIEYGVPLVPKIVLWFYYEGNDIGDLGWRQNTILSRYVQDPSYRRNLPAFQDEIDRHLRSIDALQIDARNDAMQSVNDPAAVRINWHYFVRLYTIRYALGVSQVFRPHLVTQFAQILRRAKNTVGQWGGAACVRIRADGRQICVNTGRVGCRCVP